MPVCLLFTPAFRTCVHGRGVRGPFFDHKLTIFGLVGRDLVADVDGYHRLRDLDGVGYYTWRSGVKHDAASVMEFRKSGDTLVNGSMNTLRLNRPTSSIIEVFRSRQ